MFQRIGFYLGPRQWLWRLVHYILTLFLGILLLTGLILTIQARQLFQSRQAGTITSTSLSEETDVRELNPGKPIERDLTAAQAHAYKVTLLLGQFLLVVVDQREVDLVATLYGPNDQKLAEFDSRWYGPEFVSFIAEMTGTYRIEVRSQDKLSVPERYQLKIAELRAAIPRDRTRVSGDRAFAEGRQLHNQGEAESLRRAIVKYEEALALYGTLGDRYGEAEAVNSIGHIYGLLDEKQKALDYYGRALPLRQAAGDRAGEADTLNNIGIAYDDLGEKQKALDQ
jgi:tetratricopeptide (TPR) repeat protein